MNGGIVMVLGMVIVTGTAACYIVGFIIKKIKLHSEYKQMKSKG